VAGSAAAAYLANLSEPSSATPSVGFADELPGRRAAVAEAGKRELVYRASRKERDLSVSIVMLQKRSP
jgi:hypothetical protein